MENSGWGGDGSSPVRMAKLQYTGERYYRWRQREAAGSAPVRWSFIPMKHTHAIVNVFGYEVATSRRHPGLAARTSPIVFRPSSVSDRPLIGPRGPAVRTLARAPGRWGNR